MANNSAVNGKPGKEIVNGSPDSKSGKNKKELHIIDAETLAVLIKRGREKGFLTYDEVNRSLPKNLRSSEVMDEVLIVLEDNSIQIVEKEESISLELLKSGSKKDGVRAAVVDMSEFGAVTDPVKMYLREMGLVTLLSREGEVEIAKKIEEGEQKILRALLDTTTAIECLKTLGEKIEEGMLRPKYVLRDLDEGEVYVHED